MVARSLFEVATGKIGKAHRTGQPVRRNSYRVGEREGRFWSRFNKGERNARMRAAEEYDRKHKEPGKRNGPLGHVALEILREMMRRIDFKTGRLDPAIGSLAEKLRRSPTTIVKGLARLRDHGFINWIRRFEPIEHPDDFGPQVKQASNAYWFGLPKEAADMVRRLMGRSPVPADEVTRREEEEEQTAAMLASISAEDLARFRAGDTALGDILAALGRHIDLNAITPGGKNPALQS